MSPELGEYARSMGSFRVILARKCWDYAVLRGFLIPRLEVRFLHGPFEKPRLRGFFVSLGERGLRACPQDVPGSAYDSRAHLLPAFGGMPVEDVTTDAIERWLAHFDGSARTRNKLLIQLHGILRRARKVNRLPGNAAAEVEKFPQRRSGDIEVFSPEEVWALVRAATCEHALPAPCPARGGRQAGCEGVHSRSCASRRDVSGRRPGTSRDIFGPFGTSWDDFGIRRPERRPFRWPGGPNSAAFQALVGLRGGRLGTSWRCRLQLRQTGRGAECCGRRIDDERLLAVRVVDERRTAH